MTAARRSRAPTQPAKRRTLAAAAAALVLTAVVAACGEATAGAPTAYRFGFDGQPDAPQPFIAAGWDVQVHKRDHHLRPGQLDPMQAEHGPGCEGPHLSHHHATVAQAVFLCRDHVMTAIHAEDYGLVYLTPDHLVDFSAGEAVVRIDVSTHRGSTRDWWDLWITPWDDQLVRPFDLGDVDLQGPPRNALHVRMLSENVLCIDEYRDGVAITPHHLESGCTWWAPYDEWLTPDAARRDTFEIRISATQVSVGMPAYDRTFHVWTPPSPIPWRQGIVQLGHHSYTPTKDGAGAPHTWHWDDLEIDPALPFRMIGAVGGPHAYVRDVADGPCTDECTVAFEHPAPADAHLRFVAWGTVDIDVGDGWRRVEGNRPRTKNEHAMSYFVPIPEGTQSVRFRFGDSGWWSAAQGAMATGFGIWSQAAGEVGSAPPPRGADPEGDAFGAVWLEVPGNPLLPLFDCPDWHCLGHTDPWVAPGADGELVAWFSTGGDLGGPVVGRARVGASLSLKLDPPDRPVLQMAEGVWDVYRETVSTRFDPDEALWTMWYLGYAVSFFDDPGIGQARSLDAAGTAWERPAEPIYRPAPDGWDFAFVTGPAFVEAPDGQWRIYYVGAGTTVGVGLLLSDDRGATWRPHPGNPVFERDLTSWDQGVLEPSVLHVDDGDGGRYLMWYAGYEEPLDLATTPISIGLATSPDGIVWTRSPHNPVLGPGAPGTWNDLRVVSPHVVVARDGSLLLFAHGQNRATGIDRAMGQLGVWRSEGPGTAR